MDETPLERAWRTALEERPWEPPGGWEARLRSERRRLVLTDVSLAAALVLLAVGLHVVEEPPRPWYVLTGLAGAVLGEFVRLFRSSRGRGRARWAEETRRIVRTGHAIRAHVSVGLDHRCEVTDRAEQIRTVSSLACFGWPMTALTAIGLGTSEFGMAAPIEVLYVAAVVLACAGLLVRSQRRARWARRWLADPLPRS